MEAQGGAGAFAGHGPLLDAYAALRERFPVLDDSGIVSAEMEAQAARVLGLEGATGPSDPPDMRPSDDDDPQVDAFAAALEARLSEVVAWRNAIRARQPLFVEDAAEAWRRDAARGSAIRPSALRAPVACLARLEPPPPPWFVPLFAGTHDPGEDYPTARGPRDTASAVLAHILQCAPQNGGVFFGRAWLERARAAKRATDERSWHDWSVAAVVAPRLLRLDGAEDPDALRSLAWRARSPAPGKAWLDEAGRLLASTDGIAAIAAAARWVDQVAAPIAGQPDRETRRLSGVFEAFCEHARAKMARHGGDADAAALSEIQDVGHFGENANGWCGLAPRGESDPSVLSEENDTILRGCVWLLALAPSSGTADRLGRTASACLAKGPLYGQYRSLKGLNACLWALGRIATPEAVTALGRVKLKVRDERIAKQIAKAMAEAAERAGMSIEDLEEVAVPFFGLEGEGRSRIGLAGGCSAELSVVSGTEAVVSLLRADGKPAKGVPAAVKADAESAAALKALKASAKEIS
jgi:hypothetical protein